MCNSSLLRVRLFSRTLLLLTTLTLRSPATSGPTGKAFSEPLREHHDEEVSRSRTACSIHHNGPISCNNPPKSIPSCLLHHAQSFAMIEMTGNISISSLNSTLEREAIVSECHVEIVLETTVEEDKNGLGSTSSHLSLFYRIQKLHCSENNIRAPHG